MDCSRLIDAPGPRSDDQPTSFILFHAACHRKVIFSTRDAETLLEVRLCNDSRGIDLFRLSVIPPWTALLAVLLGVVDELPRHLLSSKADIFLLLANTIWSTHLDSPQPFKLYVCTI